MIELPPAECVNRFLQEAQRLGIEMRWTSEGMTNLDAAYHARPGAPGVLLLHDAWMPSVQKTRDFINTNLRNLAQFNITRPRRPGRSASAISAPTTIEAFVKLRGDRREWDHYAAF